MGRLLKAAICHPKSCHFKVNFGGSLLYHPLELTAYLHRDDVSNLWMWREDWYYPRIIEMELEEELKTKSGKSAYNFRTHTGHNLLNFDPCIDLIVSFQDAIIDVYRFVYSMLDRDFDTELMSETAQLPWERSDAGGISPELFALAHVVAWRRALTAYNVQHPNMMVRLPLVNLSFFNLYTTFGLKDDDLVNDGGADNVSVSAHESFPSSGLDEGISVGGGVQQAAPDPASVGAGERGDAGSCSPASSDDASLSLYSIGEIVKDTFIENDNNRESEMERMRNDHAQLIQSCIQRYEGIAKEAEYKRDEAKMEAETLKEEKNKSDASNRQKIECAQKQNEQLRDQIRHLEDSVKEAKGDRDEARREAKSLKEKKNKIDASNQMKIARIQKLMNDLSLGIEEGNEETQPMDCEQKNPTSLMFGSSGATGTSVDNKRRVGDVHKNSLNVKRMAISHPELLRARNNLHT